MNRLLYTLIVACVLLMSSCSKELFNGEWTTDAHSMPRYLSKVTEYLHANSYHEGGVNTVLFSKPSYDMMSRISMAYHNFWGENANCYYTYAEDAITVNIISADGRVTTRQYYLEDGLIRSCIETAGNELIGRFEYQYDNNRITKFFISLDIRDATFDLVWNDSNLVQVYSPDLYNGRFEYQRHDDYKVGLPMFHLASIHNSIGRLDVILMAEGYFGNSISKDLPVKEYTAFNILTREFEYHLDKEGYIDNIKHVRDGKTIREYNFVWR